MKILVTGGAGYIGSILVPELLTHGHLVTVLDNFMYNQAPLLDKCISDNLRIVRGDVTDRFWMKDFLKNNKFEVIIPLACLTGAPLCDKNPERAYDVIVASIKFLLQWIDKDVRIIYPTTNSGYGVGEKDKYCTEETPLNPISNYGRWKCEAEKDILKHGNSVSFRLATAFGLSPRMRLDLLVNDFVYRAVHDRNIALYEPEYMRNFIHVRDIAKAIHHCIIHWELMQNETYNVGLSSANISKRDLAKKIREQIPELTISEIVSVHGDVDKRDYIVSNEKLEATGWKPIFTLEDGIKELIKGYKIIKRNEYSNI